MTQEEKQLLLKDLCARLPYCPKIYYYYLNKNLVEKEETRELDFNDIKALKYNNEHQQDFWCVTVFKPYLRPMSSMTDEENEIVTNISNNGNGFVEDEDGWIRCDSIHTKWGVWPDGCAKLLDYLNSIHVDYRGLIPMGLALEAPEGMYN